MKPIGLLFLSFAAHQFPVFVGAQHESLLLNESASNRDLLDPKIVGGTFAGTGEFPFYALPGGDSLCGSAKIWDDVLISAAHCAGSFTGNDIYIGGNLASGEDAVEIIQAESERPHPQYDSNTDRNDFMLVKLRNKSNSPNVPWNKDRNVPMDGQTIVLMGFGDTSDGGQLSDNLKKASVNIVSFQNCRATYADLDDATMFCAYKANTDSCQGDR